MRLVAVEPAAASTKSVCVGAAGGGGGRGTTARSMIAAEASDLEMMVNVKLARSVVKLARSVVKLTRSVRLRDRCSGRIFPTHTGRQP